MCLVHIFWILEYIIFDLKEIELRNKGIDIHGGNDHGVWVNHMLVEVFLHMVEAPLGIGSLSIGLKLLLNMPCVVHCFKIGVINLNERLRFFVTIFFPGLHS